MTLAVILWGAYVRPSGAGAGCGSHWPTCNGEVIQRPHSTATIIEFTHRATSGLCLLLIAAQLVWALSLFPRGHGARRAAGGQGGIRGHGSHGGHSANVPPRTGHAESS